MSTRITLIKPFYSTLGKIDQRLACCNIESTLSSQIFKSWDFCSIVMISPCLFPGAANEASKFATYYMAFCFTLSRLLSKNLLHTSSSEVEYHIETRLSFERLSQRRSFCSASKNQSEPRQLNWSAGGRLLKIYTFRNLVM